MERHHRRAAQWLGQRGEVMAHSARNAQFERPEEVPGGGVIADDHALAQRNTLPGHRRLHQQNVVAELRPGWYCDSRSAPMVPTTIRDT